MLILGIETSCDETSAAVVADGRLVKSNIVSSQIAAHAPFGGVVPEIASRQHVKAIAYVVEAAISEAGVTKDDLDAVAVTYGPGLAGALLVGLSFARGMAAGLGIPLIGVNHLEGHLHSVWLTTETPLPSPPLLPMMALIVSGGHTELVLVRDHGDYEVVGRTLDDAAGEAFDKVARLLGLPYPGGPSIQAASAPADAPVPLPRAKLPGTYDFSFSGLKTAVLHRVVEMATGRDVNAARGQSLPDVDVAESLSEQQIADMAAGFQESVVDVLASKTAQAARDFAVRSVAVVGGVAANRLLRLRMREEINLPLYISELAYATDNAAMIAGAAYYSNRQAPGLLDVEPSLSLQSHRTGAGVA
ncbi:MAG TPA: tRNA (adenosine(37)-N6)-threonylcarbamoyltransferase complex transferase subunit TsaD [Chloroflexota bacterium]|nr:tRNA (adenosine(37)-N6)-threonylcarbamoyltransferase complex transferase subunit TsaD [Chloroflexota bacterium]